MFPSYFQGNSLGAQRIQDIRAYLVNDHHHVSSTGRMNDTVSDIQPLQYSAEYYPPPPSTPGVLDVIDNLYDLQKCSSETEYCTSSPPILEDISVTDSHVNETVSEDDNESCSLPSLNPFFLNPYREAFECVSIPESADKEFEFSDDYKFTPSVPKYELRINECSGSKLFNASIIRDYQAQLPEANKSEQYLLLRKRKRGRPLKKDIESPVIVHKRTYARCYRDMKKQESDQLEYVAMELYISLTQGKLIDDKVSKFMKNLLNKRQKCE